MKARLRSLAGWVFLAVLVVAWAFTLRPTQLGGPATFIVVSGDSMEPTMTSGDLVVLRERDVYAEGDIITFPVPAGEPGAGALIIHRIVDTEGDTFVPQGDNRDRVDEWRPTKDEIKGSLWLHVPHGGDVIMQVLDPPLMAALAGGSMTMWILLREPKSDRKKDDSDDQS
ncbi:signal peptidase I [uncultured Ornithinimicrobium sp.]|uniref:signal peptidase I n=1 Tax=uncultured Ornithinimicrobium sp. TaxID=259307 RepID=UPI0025957C73|nr:signal peptidase I [uncultured Ornithinimicrobium sp.]